MKQFEARLKMSPRICQFEFKSLAEAKRKNPAFTEWKEIKNGK